MPRLKRPSRLLDLDKSPAEKQKITTANASRSPLLRLPAEIRCRIFDLVLGEKIIHIFEDGGFRKRSKYRLAICTEYDDRHHEQSKSRVRGLEACQHLNVKKLVCGWGENYSMESHANQCHSNLHQQLTLSLLQTCRQTCRQIYQEASLLPFTKNTLTSDVTDRLLDKHAIQGFLNALIPAQARSIACLAFTDEVDRETQDGPRYAGILRLTGLKTLHLTFLIRQYTPLSPADLKKWIRREFDVSDYDSLSQLPLRSVRFNLAVSGWSSVTKPVKASEVNLRDIEQMLEEEESKALGSPDAFFARKVAQEEQKKHRQGQANDDRLRCRVERGLQSLKAIAY